MNNLNRFLVIIFFGLVFTALLYSVVPLQPTEKEDDEESAEKRPKFPLSAEEMVVNQRHFERNQSKGLLKNASLSSSYADGAITGEWSQVSILSSGKQGYGFRVDGSVYDQYNDVLYAVSYAGHLWRIDRDENNPQNTKWVLINHKDNFKDYIEGLNKSNGSFRMIRSSDQWMQFSDDEGRTWTNASGVQFQASTQEGAIVKYNSGNRIAVVGQIDGTYLRPYLSIDNGQSYSSTQQVFNKNSYEVKLFKPSFSESVFMVVWNKSSQKINIYECGPTDSDFKLVQSPSSSFVGIDRVIGTYSQDKYHFYIAAKNTHIYYSENAGESWVTKNSGNSGDGDINLRTVYPTKPNVIFRGYLDVYISTNSGSTFSNFSHLLGWDVHHMKMYQKKDLSYFHFVGKDFGCYISYAPDIPNSYIQLNNSSPTQMCYDASNSQEYNSSFTSTQDRGTMAFEANSDEVYTQDVRTTDGLRVTVANSGESVWTWMYFGTIYHTSNFAARNSGLQSLNFTGNWWAAPMIASPNLKEDAVYVAAGNKLKKFTYNPASESIIQTEHYFNFNKETNSEITGFGYSPLNTNRWYVSVKTGDFLYSEDGGQTFKHTSYSGTRPRANDASYNYQKNQHVIKASKTDEKKVYYAGVGNVFLISDDGGQTFTDHSTGLDVYRIRDFDVTPDEKFIFAACAQAGLWVYSAEKDQWFEMGDAPVPYVDFTAHEYLVKENTLSVATYGCGILKFKLNVAAPALLSPENLKIEGVSADQIQLSWEDRSDNETGFEIERAINGTFVKLATVAANANTYTDNSPGTPNILIYRVKAVNATSGSYYSNYVLTDYNPGVISKKKWKLVSVDSEETIGSAGSATLAFDDNASTIWHTQWYQVSPVPGLPHQIIIDMNDTLSLKGFRYLPRQDNNLNGTIKDYEFYVSIDNQNWQLASKSSWAKTTEEKTVVFSSPFQARYIKLVALSEVNGSVLSSCAEISVFTKLPTPEIPAAPQFIQGGRLSDSEIELVWLDLSKNEDGYTIEQLIDGSYQVINQTGANSTSFKLSNTAVNKPYTFRISAFNSVGKSNYSDEITIGSNDGTTNIFNVKSDNPAVKIYPNPFTDFIHIQLPKPGLFSGWQIIDMNGTRRKDGTISDVDNELTIRLQDIKSGTYIIRVYGEDTEFKATIIKKP